MDTYAYKRMACASHNVQECDSYFGTKPSMPHKAI